MIQRFAKNRYIRGSARLGDTREGVHQPDIGKVAGTEVQGIGIGNPRIQAFSQSRFQPRMNRAMTTDQRGGTTARAFAKCAVRERLRNYRVVGKTQVVVTAKREQRAAVNLNACAT